MGGTDLNDQYNSYYRSTYSTKKWAPRIFSHFLMLSITNARALYMSFHDMTDPKSLPLFEFIDSILNSLIQSEDNNSSSSESEGDEEAPLPKKRRSVTTQLGCVTRLKGHAHTPANDGNTRRNCPVCDKRSRIFCVECNTCLHIDGDGEDSCWWRYHNLDTFREGDDEGGVYEV